MRYIALLWLLLLLGLQHCGKASRPAKQVCLLYDLSESTNRQEVRDAYVAATEKILPAMRPGDVLLAALITERSTSELHFGLQYEFPRFMPSTDNLLIEKKERELFEKHQRAVRDSLLAVVDSLLHHPPRRIMKTEIIGALQVVERVFKTYEQPRKVLVILSDMVEDSDFYNFGKEQLTKQRISRIIEAEKRAQRLPELTGARVYAVGAMAQKTKRFLQIRNFWIKYFSACGATLLEKHYGPTLIRFEE